MIKQRKPIIQADGSEDLHKYKYRYCHTGYILNIPIKIYTDLTERQFDCLCDGKYTGKQIRKFELTGKF